MFHLKGLLALAVAIPSILYCTPTIPKSGVHFEQQKDSGPVTIPIIKNGNEFFVSAKVNGVAEPFLLAFNRVDSRLDPYLEPNRTNYEGVIDIQGMHVKVPVKAALGPMGFFTADKKTVVGYLGQDAFAGYVCLFTGSSFTVFTPAQWDEYRDQASMPASQSISIPLKQLKSGLYALDMKSQGGGSISADFALGANLITCSLSVLPKVWLGLSQELAEPTDGKSIIGGLKLEDQSILPFGVALRKAPIDQYQPEIQLALTDHAIPGNEFAINFKSHQLILQKKNPFELLSYFLDKGGVFPCHSSQGKIYLGDGDMPAPADGPESSPIIKIGAITIDSLASWIIGKSGTEVQNFEKAYDSIIAAESKTNKLDLTFDTPKGPVVVEIKLD